MNTKAQQNYMNSFKQATAGGARVRAFISAHGIFQPDSCYFDDESMAFFGDTVSNYSIPKNPVNVLLNDGEKKQAIALRRSKAVKGGLTSTAYFDVDTLAKLYVSEEL